MFNPDQIKQDFPILQRQVHGQPLVYLDSAATSQKPQSVIDAITDYYTQHNANVHRGVHLLSDESSELYERSRRTIAQFFGADQNELILVRNTTEAINGVAYGWADAHLQAGDVILTTLLEHHSDFVVWQEVCRRTGAKLEFLDVDEQGKISLEQLEQKISQLPVKLVAMVHVSNTTGTLNPIQQAAQLIKTAQKESGRQIRFLVDGAQSAPHLPVNFHQLGVDFFVFSGHKMLGPMGVGGLLVKMELLKSEEMKPWLFGGGMIAEVYPDHTLYQEEACERFTAGTPDVASAVGLAAACDYLTKIGMADVAAHDRSLVKLALTELNKIPELTIIGPQDDERIGSVAFIHQRIHAHDVAQILDSAGVAVRSGHHCTMPLHLQFSWQATVRASFHIYNSEADIKALVAGLDKVKQVFG